MEQAERIGRELGRRGATTGRHVYVAGATALTEPGPAAIGIAVTDEQDRLVAHRAHYLGRATRAEATAQALLEAVRLVQGSEIEKPVFRTDDPALVDALRRGGELPGLAAPLVGAIRQALSPLAGYEIEVVTASANRARQIALSPLIDWLPERTRRSEALTVRPVTDGVYEVASESTPGQTYRVSMSEPGVGHEDEPRELLRCECADFTHRGIPCKHLLAVARETGALERLFYPARSEITH